MQASFLTGLVYIMTILASLVFIWLVSSVFTTPSGVQIRSVCLKHDGVASTDVPALILNLPIVTCRDGYAGYAPP